MGVDAKLEGNTRSATPTLLLVLGLGIEDVDAVAKAVREGMTAAPTASCPPFPAASMETVPAPPPGLLSFGSSVPPPSSVTEARAQAVGTLLPMSPWLCSGMVTARAAGRTGRRLASVAPWMSIAALEVPATVVVAWCPWSTLAEGAVQSIRDVPVHAADGDHHSTTGGGAACRETTATSRCP